LTLGPEQLAVVGCGEYSSRKYDLGVQEDILIPRSIQPVPAHIHTDGTNCVMAMIPALVTGDLRIVMRQSAGGKPVRTSAGAPPDGTTLGKLLQLKATQGDRLLPIRINYDKALWSGLSWAVGEIPHQQIRIGQPIKIRCVSSESQPVDIQVQFYAVSYE
jgi:hypothetical protein